MMMLSLLCLLCLVDQAESQPLWYVDGLNWFYVLNFCFFFYLVPCLPDRIKALRCVIQWWGYKVLSGNIQLILECMHGDHYKDGYYWVDILFLLSFYCRELWFFIGLSCFFLWSKVVWVFGIRRPSLPINHKQDRKIER